MSPQQTSGQKVTPLNNLYTVILAVAFGLTFATVCYVLYVCYVQYGTILPPQ